MGKNIPFPAGNALPVVGQPFTALAFVPTIVAKCNCKPNNPVFVISGIQAGMQCHECLKLYFIGSINFDRNTGQMHVALACEPPVVGGQESAPKPRS